MEGAIEDYSVIQKAIMQFVVFVAQMSINATLFRDFKYFFVLAVLVSFILYVLPLYSESRILQAREITVMESVDLVYQTKYYQKFLLLMGILGTMCAVGFISAFFVFSQGGSPHLGMEFNQTGGPMQAETGSSWIPGIRDNTTGTQNIPGPPSFMAGQTGPASQPPRPPALSSDMESALLQQVMSLTPEQINLLPPEQRNQVLQLQQMLRQSQ